jgi:hypothetical protein
MIFWLVLKLGKLSSRGVHGLGSMAFGLAVQKFLNIESVFD